MKRKGGGKESKKGGNINLSSNKQLNKKKLKIKKH